MVAGLLGVGFQKPITKQPAGDRRYRFRGYPVLRFRFSAKGIGAYNPAVSTFAAKDAKRNGKSATKIPGVLSVFLGDLGGNPS
jgi:hypothetical protein